MNLDKAFVKQVSRTQDFPAEWIAWIPPRGPQDYDGDQQLAPYGTSYWPTQTEAFTFIERVFLDPSF